MRSALIAGMWLMACPSLAATDVEKLRKSVTYVEQQSRADAPPLGRTFESGKGPQGVDVDSTLRVRVDRAKVVEAIAGAAPSGEVTFDLLREQIQALTRLSAGVEQIAQQQARYLAAYRNAVKDPATYATEQKAQARLVRSHLDPLRATVKARGLAEGQSESEAEQLAIQAESDLLVGPGYDPTRFVAAYSGELRRLQEQFDHLLRTRGEGIGLEIRAHLYSADGGVSALRLLNYNSEQGAAPRPFARIAFEMTEKERATYAAYDQLAKQVGETRSAAEAVRRTFEAAYPEQIASIRDAFLAVATQAEAAQESLAGLATWFDPDRLAAWLSTEAPQLSAPVRQRLEQVLESARLTRTDLEALKGLRKLMDELPGMTPVQAHDALVQLSTQADGVLSRSRWDARVVAWTALAADLPAVAADLKSREGPFKAYQAASNELKALFVRGQEAATKVKEIYNFLRAGASAEVVGGAPEPRLQRRLGVSDALDTETDLQRAANRSEDDTVVFNYRFYSQDRVVAEWEDRFVLRSYGVRMVALASLAFWTRDTSEMIWNPAPAISWIVNFRCWPGSTDNGLPSFWTDLVGVGLTAMTVDYDPRNGFELGIGGTLSLFRNFLQVGYGVNLQNFPSPGYWYFSIRPLEMGGLFGTRSQ